MRFDGRAAGSELEQPALFAGCASESAAPQCCVLSSQYAACCPSVPRAVCAGRSGCRAIADTAIESRGLEGGRAGIQINPGPGARLAGARRGRLARDPGQGAGGGRVARRVTGPLLSPAVAHRNREAPSLSAEPAQAVFACAGGVRRPARVDSAMRFNGGDALAVGRRFLFGTSSRIPPSRAVATGRVGGYLNQSGGRRRECDRRRLPGAPRSRRPSTPERSKSLMRSGRYAVSITAIRIFSRGTKAGAEDRQAPWMAPPPRLRVSGAGHALDDPDALPAQRCRVVGGSVAPAGRCGREQPASAGSARLQGRTPYQDWADSIPVAAAARCR